MLLLLVGAKHMVAVSNGSPMIELKRLHRFFGGTPAVNDISFEVYPGQVFGYIGPNGAAKQRACGYWPRSTCQGRAPGFSWTAFR